MKYLYIFICLFSLSNLSASCYSRPAHLVEELHKMKEGKDVFVVRIDSTSHINNRGYKSFGTVLHVYKGKVSIKVKINSGGFTTAGGQNLIKGEQYLVFANIGMDGMKLLYVIIYLLKNSLIQK